MGDKTPGIKSSKEEKTTDLPNSPTNVALAIADGDEKLEKSLHDGHDTVEALSDETVAHAKGFEVLFVMLAILLSITFVALDQVGSVYRRITDLRLQTQILFQDQLTCPLSDNSSNSDTEDHRPIPTT
jgi:hypothetical protein